MGDMDNIMNRIEEIKKELNNLQEKLKTEKVYGKEKHGLVRTVVNGKGKILDFEFDNGVVDKEFKEAIIDSVNDALEKAEKLEKEKKQKIVGNIDVPDVPGLF